MPSCSRTPPDRTGSPPTQAGVMFVYRTVTPSAQISILPTTTGPAAKSTRRFTGITRTNVGSSRSLINDSSVPPTYRPTITSTRQPDPRPEPAANALLTTPLPRPSAGLAAAQLFGGSVPDRRL